MQMSRYPLGSVEPTVFAAPLRTMACYRGFITVMLIAAVHASNEPASLPNPYAPPGFEVESNNLPIEEDAVAAPSSYYQHNTAVGSAPEGFHVQSGYEGIIGPALTGAYGLTSIKPGLIEKIKPHLFSLIAFLPKIAAGALGLVAILLVGTLLTTSVCAFTSLCHLSLLGYKVTGDSFRSYMTPDHISEAASFLQKSIKKFQELTTKTSKRSVSSAD